MSQSEAHPPGPDVDSKVDSSPSAKIQSLLAQSATFDDNFTVTHSTTLPYALSAVFPVFGHGDTLEAPIRLSALCVDFALLHHDTVALPAGVALSDPSIRVRDRPSAGPEGGSTLPRQYFRLTEAVPLLGGIIKHNVDIAGALTWDEPNSVALYETAASGGVRIWKSRVFEEVEGGTKITEVIRGNCPGWMKSMVRNETDRSHKAHMDSYITLFQDK